MWGRHGQEAYAADKNHWSAARNVHRVDCKTYEHDSSMGAE